MSRDSKLAALNFGLDGKSDPPPVSSTHQVMDLFALDQESRSYEYEFDPSVEAILSDIERTLPFPHVVARLVLVVLLLQLQELSVVGVMNSSQSNYSCALY